MSTQLSRGKIKKIFPSAEGSLAAEGERGPPGQGVIRHDMAWGVPPPDGGILAGEHRHSRPPQAAILRALRQGVFHLQRRTAVSAEPLALC